MTPLPAPPYAGTSPVGLGLAVESMRSHMTDEGWQIFAGLEHAGYKLAGRRLPIDEVHVPTILERTNPGVVMVMDKREYDVSPKCFRDKEARFFDVNVLASRPDLFKLTILKDAHQNNPYHRESAQEIGCHAWVVYYDPATVHRLAPYTRLEHLIRTYHSIDPAIVPDYSPDGRDGCLLSGAVSGAYPLRQRLVASVHELPRTTYLKHPGYHMRGCATPDFLRLLSKFKVSICTSSVYGYALRKIMESTAAGCVVITDLPVEDHLPEIDGNLVRVDPRSSVGDVARQVERLCRVYDPERQRHFARLALSRYDYREVGVRLAADIEAMRRNYP